MLVEPSFEQTIFDLLDTLSSGNIKKAILLYQGLRSVNIEPIYVMSMIGWGLNNLLIIKAGAESGKNPNEIAKDFKISPYVVQKSLNQVRRLTLQQIKQAVRTAASMDEKLKTTSLDPNQGIEQLIYLVGDSFKG